MWVAIRYEHRLLGITADDLFSTDTASFFQPRVFHLLGGARPVGDAALFERKLRATTRNGRAPTSLRYCNNDAFCLIRCWGLFRTLTNTELCNEDRSCTK